MSQNVFRAKKARVIQDTNVYYNDFNYVFYINYYGVSVTGLTSLRRGLTDSKVVVLKNTLNKISASKADFNHVSQELKGQIVSVFTNDPVTTAKSIKKFLQENKTAKFVAFADNANKYDANYMQTISNLPSLQELRGKIASLLVAPHRKLAYALQAVPTNVARIISLKEGN